MEVDSSDFEVVQRANALYKSNKHVEALYIYALLPVDKIDEPIMLNISSCYKHTGYFVKAENFARLAIAMNPNSKGYFRLGSALKGQQRYGEAIDAIETGLSINPNDQNLLRLRRDYKNQFARNPTDPPITHSSSSQENDSLGISHDITNASEELSKQLKCPEHHHHRRRRRHSDKDNQQDRHRHKHSHSGRHDGKHDHGVSNRHSEHDGRSSDKRRKGIQTHYGDRHDAELSGKPDRPEHDNGQEYSPGISHDITNASEELSKQLKCPEHHHHRRRRRHSDKDNQQDRHRHKHSHSGRHDGNHDHGVSNHHSEHDGRSSDKRRKGIQSHYGDRHDADKFRGVGIGDGHDHINRAQNDTVKENLGDWHSHGRSSHADAEVLPTTELSSNGDNMKHACVVVSPVPLSAAPLIQSPLVTSVPHPVKPPLLSTTQRAVKTPYDDNDG